jgi:hypothetical protein
MVDEVLPAVVVPSSTGHNMGDNMVLRLDAIPRHNCMSHR